MSLSAHLLIHVRDATERSVKNPKFYENLIFHSVPKEKQVIVLTCVRDVCSRRVKKRMTTDLLIITKWVWASILRRVFCQMDFLV